MYDHINRSARGIRPLTNHNKNILKTKRILKRILNRSGQRILNRAGRSSRIPKSFQNQESFYLFVERFTMRDCQVKRVDNAAND